MKIGFIAMSGVRAHNKALTDLDINDGTILERNNIQLESVK